MQYACHRCAVVAKGYSICAGQSLQCGGAAVDGLEMAQNSMRLSWTHREVDQRLKLIMHDIHRNCLAAAEQYGNLGNYVDGANIAGFIRVADAMIDQGAE